MLHKSPAFADPTFLFLPIIAFVSRKIKERVESTGKILRPSLRGFIQSFQRKRLTNGESYSIIPKLSGDGKKRATHMEKSRSWPSAHDWKSCIPQKGIEGSNPSFSAKRKNLTHRVGFFLLAARRHLNNQMPRSGGAWLDVG